MGDKISNEKLFRNVPLGQFDEDFEEPHPAAIWPSSRDEGKLSTDRAQVWSAQKSYDHRVKTLNLASKGVLSIDSDYLETVPILTVEDPLTEGVDEAEADNPAHALSDFGDLVNRSKPERKLARETILAAVMVNGWAYGPI